MKTSFWVSFTIIFLNFSAIWAKEGSGVLCVTCGRQLPRTSRSDSLHPVFSGDGRFVFFETKKKMNWSDEDKSWDVYSYDTENKKITLLNSTQIKKIMTQPSVGALGNKVAFVSEPKVFLKVNNPTSDIFVVHPPDKDDVLLSMGFDGKSGNGQSKFPRMSSEGDFVLFTSNATNLVPGVSVSLRQVYLYDKALNAIQLMSKNAQGAPANRPCVDAKMSANARYIVFKTPATNLAPALPIESLTPHLYMLARETGQMERLDTPEKNFDGQKWVVGEFDVDNWGNVLFDARPRSDENPEFTLKSKGLFCLLHASNQINRIIPGPYKRGIETPALNRDGQFAVFVVGNSSATAKDGGVVVFEMSTGAYALAVTGRCRNPVISGDGQTVAFESNDAGLVGRSEVGVYNILLVKNPFLGAKNH